METMTKTVLKIERLEHNKFVPEYKTEGAAGMDLCAAISEPVTLKPLERKLIPTGLKAYMLDDEVLMIVPRSSGPKKQGIVFPHSMGVIDSDYYGNPDNDGHIMFAFYNIKDTDTEIKKGDCIGQGIFEKYFVTDDDNAQGERTGGFGSTNK